MKKPYYKKAVALGAMLAAMDAHGVVAQDADEDFFALEEIVITAQKRAESLQDASISVAAFSKNDLLKNGIDAIQDYAYLTPGLSIDEGQNASDVTVVIRGIGNLGGIQNLFGLYVDGVEMTAASNRTLGMALLDVGMVEVLRGPQGTTFGRNVVSGAVNITSTEPDYEFGGESNIEYGRFGEFSTQHIINIPLLEDKVALRLSGRYSQGDGYLENVGPAGDSNDHESYVLKGTLLFELNDRLRAKITTTYSDQDFGAESMVPDGRLIGNVLFLQGLIDSGLGLLPPGSLPAGPDLLFPEQNRQIATNTPTDQTIKNFSTSANISYDFADGDISFVTVAGYVETDLTSQVDIDQSQFDTVFQTNVGNDTFRSLEMRFQSNDWERINWIAGGYYSKSKSNGSFDIYSGTEMEALTYLHPLLTGLPVGISLLPNNTRISGNSNARSLESWAMFGEVSYAATDRLTLKAGARYNKDKVFQSVWDGVDIGNGPVFPLLAVVARDDASDRSSSDKVTWRLNASYALTDDVNVYAGVSTGYRAGGLQLGNVDNPDYAPENLTNYEVGVKALWMDGRVRTNLAVYRMNWRDVQIRTLNRTNNMSFTDNAGKAYVQGFELDVAAQFNEHWSLDGGVSYVDTKITDYIDSTGLDRSGTVMPNTPELSTNLSLQYTHPIKGDMEAFVRATHIYTDERLEGLIDGDSALQFIDSFNRVDLRAGVSSSSWRLEGYITNLFDELYATGSISNGFSASGSYVASPPQTFGVKLSVFY